MINVDYILSGDKRKIYLYKSLKFKKPLKLRASSKEKADEMAERLYPNLVYIGEFKPIT